MLLPLFASVMMVLLTSPNIKFHKYFMQHF